MQRKILALVMTLSVGACVKSSLDNAAVIQAGYIAVAQAEMVALKTASPGDAQIIRACDAAAYAAIAPVVKAMETGSSLPETALVAAASALADLRVCVKPAGVKL